MVPLGALEVSKLPLLPECQHLGVVVRELKLHNPQKNDKVYICSPRTDKRVVIESLQFICPGDSTNKSNWKVTPLGKKPSS